MTPIQNRRVSQVHLVGQPFSWHFLRKPPKKHHDCRAVVMGPRPYRVGEDIEHRPALPAAVVHDWLSSAVMRSLVTREFVTVRAGKPLWMKRPFQILVAFLLTKKLVDGKPDHVDGKPDHGNTWRPISWNTPFWPLQKHVAEVVQLRANMSQALYLVSPRHAPDGPHWWVERPPHRSIWATASTTRRTSYCGESDY